MILWFFIAVSTLQLNAFLWHFLCRKQIISMDSIALLPHKVIHIQIDGFKTLFWLYFRDIKSVFYEDECIISELCKKIVVNVCINGNTARETDFTPTPSPTHFNHFCCNNPCHFLICFHIIILKLSFKLFRLLFQKSPLFSLLWSQFLFSPWSSIEGLVQNFSTLSQYRFFLGLWIAKLISDFNRKSEFDKECCWLYLCLSMHHPQNSY